MTENEATKRLEYLAHAMQNSYSQMKNAKEAQNRGRPLTSEEQFRMYRSTPVCPKCMKMAFRDKGWAKESRSTCPSCGWSGKTVTMDEVMREKLYR